MANVKISDLTEDTNPADGDWVETEDISANASKKVTRTNFFLAPPYGLNSIPASALAASAITLGYTQTTTNASIATGVETQWAALATTCTIPAGGRKVRVTAYVSRVTNTNANTIAYLGLWEGVVGVGTHLQLAQIVITNATFGNFMIAQAVYTPSAGSKTFNAAIAASANTGTYEASATTPAFLLIEAI